MNKDRKKQLFLSLINKYEEELENKEGIFLLERPFLLDKSLEPKITFMPEKRAWADIKIKVLEREIERLRLKLFV